MSDDQGSTVRPRDASTSTSSDGWTNAQQPGNTPFINSIYDFSSEALGQLKLWLEMQGLNVPIKSLVGFNLSNSTLLVQDSAVTSIPDATWTPIVYDTRVFDLPDGTMFDSAGSNIYCRSDGKYMPYAHISFASDATGYRACRIMVNGSEVARTRNTWLPVTGVSTSRSIVFPPVDLISGDGLSLEVFQTSGGDLNVNGTVDSGFGLTKLT